MSLVVVSDENHLDAKKGAKLGVFPCTSPIKCRLKGNAPAG